MPEANSKRVHTIVSLPTELAHPQWTLAMGLGHDLGIHRDRTGSSFWFFLLPDGSVQLPDGKTQRSELSLKRALGGKGIISIPMEDTRQADAQRIDEELMALSREIISREGYRHTPERRGKVTHGAHGFRRGWWRPEVN